MGIFGSIWTSIFGGSATPNPADVQSLSDAAEAPDPMADSAALAINPASGLAMIGGEAGVDTDGNAFGTSNTFDDDIFGSNSGSSFDDPW